MYAPPLFTSTTAKIAQLEAQLVEVADSERAAIEASIATQRALLPSRAVFMGPVGEYTQTGWYYVGQPPSSPPAANPAAALADYRAAQEAPQT